MLTQGGDERIALLEGRSHNKYFVQPYPALSRIEFSSSTASHVSIEAYGEIGQFKQRLDIALQSTLADVLYSQECGRLQHEFFRLWGLDEAEVDWLIAASGTDAHADAAKLSVARFGRAFRIIMPESRETGTHVTAAMLRGSHLNGKALAEITEIPLRNPDGSVRTSAEIDQDFQQAAADSLRQNIPVLLVRFDESKSGCVAPGMDMLNSIRSVSPEQVGVLVDASQLRISPGRLQNYLADDCLVVVTGSKFFGAPSFCGALLTPKNLSWKHSLVFPEKYTPNFGLLARWQAAIHVMRSYFNIAEVDRQSIIDSFGESVLRAFGEISSIASMARVADGDHQLRSLYAFLLLDPDTGRYLSAEDARAAYLHLLSAPQLNGYTYALGQPVLCGAQENGDTQYLRISLSAPTINDFSRLSSEKWKEKLNLDVSACLHALSNTIRQIINKDHG